MKVSPSNVWLVGEDKLTELSYLVFFNKPLSSEAIAKQKDVLDSCFKIAKVIVFDNQRYLVHVFRTMLGPTPVPVKLVGLVPIVIKTSMTVILTPVKMEQHAM